MCKIARMLAVVAVLTLVASFSNAQVATGSYPYGTFDTLGPDTINVGNLNVHLSIPVLNKAGRGLPFTYALSYDNSVWYPLISNGTTAWTPVQAFGWRGSTEIATGYVSYSTAVVSKSSKTCSYTEYTYSGFTYHDPFGVQHSIIGYTRQFYGTCGGTNITTLSRTTTDGSGYSISVTNYTDALVTSASGKQISPPENMGAGSASVIDSNGNEITVDGSGHFTDTTGKVAMTVAGGAPNPQTFTYTDTNGNPQSVKMTYESYTVQTNFGCSGITEYPATQTYLVSSIVLADGVSTYTFTYEPTPGDSGKVTGRIESVTLPAGNTISYSYTGGNNGIECTDGSNAGLTRSLNSDSGSAASTWTYARSSPNGANTTHTEVVDGLQNHKAYDFVEPAPATSGTTALYYESNRSVYQGAKSGTPVLARQTCYNASTSPCTATAITPPIAQIDTYEILNGIQTHGSTVKFNASGSITESDIYDFGSSTRGPLLRQEKWTYGGNFTDLPTLDQVFDGSSNLAGWTTYAYDGGSLTQSSGVPQHISVTGPRGNLTSESIYASATTSYQLSATYEDTGSALTSTNPNGTTTLTYDPTFVYTTGESLPTPSSGIALSLANTYDTSYTGLPLTSKDPNQQPTDIVSYDPMLRPTEATFPDGGKTTLSYTSTSVTADVYQTSSAYTTSELQYDGYGRPSRSLLSNGQGTNPWYEQDTCYDANGNISQSSYQYQSTGGSGNNCSTPGDIYSYDVLGRILSVTHADGKQETWKYTGRATQFTDENGVSRVTQVDGLSRPTIVCEITSTSMQNSGSPANCGTDIVGTGYTSTYSYAIATGTATVNQGGQTRTFQTDWLGRPIETIEPESGTTTYTYTYNSTGLVVTRVRPKANQTNASVTTTTTTQYDKIGRLVSISYSDGTPTKTFAYDASAGWSSPSQSNLKGRLSIASVPTAKTIYSYDPVGRTIALGECTPSNCGTSSFTLTSEYDYEGNMTQFVDAFGPTYSYAHSLADEVQSITSNWSDSNHSAALLSSVKNGPFGPLSWNLGNGLTGVSSYDSQGRISGGWVCQGSSQPNCTGGTTFYSFTSGWTGTYLTTASDSVLDQSNSYSYDSLGHLSALTVNSGTPGSYSYTYDRWGNRWQQTETSGSGGPQPSLSFNASTNQATNTGYTYDAAGNMTSDGIHSYTYDAEGNVTQVDGGSTATYTYDALNHRVRIDNGGSHLEFIFNATGQHTSEWDATNKWENTGWTFWGSTRLSLYTAGTTEFEHQDWLGTERMRTNVSGQVLGSFKSLPFGDGYSASGTDNDPYHFATLDQDTTANDYAQFREYSNMAGRWFSPDPYSGSYDFSNPQSFNRYGYTMNNPISFTDPSGLCPLGRDGKPISSCSGGGGDGSEDSGLDVTDEFFLMEIPVVTWDWGLIPFPQQSSGWTPVAGMPGEQMNIVTADYGWGWISEGDILDYLNAIPTNGSPNNGTAQDNGPRWSQKNQDCLNKINSTPDGQFYNFFSPLSMIPGIGPEWKSSIVEDVGGGAAKFGVFKFFQGASQTMVRTPFGSMSGFVADSIEGVAEGILAPVAAAATVGQLTVHAGCAISAAF